MSDSITVENSAVASPGTVLRFNADDVAGLIEKHRHARLATCRLHRDLDAGLVDLPPRQPISVQNRIRVPGQLRQEAHRLSLRRLGSTRTCDGKGACDPYLELANASHVGVDDLKWHDSAHRTTCLPDESRRLRPGKLGCIQPKERLIGGKTHFRFLRHGNGVGAADVATVSHREFAHDQRDEILVRRTCGLGRNEAIAELADPC